MANGTGISRTIGIASRLRRNSRPMWRQYGRACNASLPQISQSVYLCLAISLLTGAGVGAWPGRRLLRRYHRDAVPVEGDRAVEGVFHQTVAGAGVDPQQPPVGHPITSEVLGRVRGRPVLEVDHEGAAPVVATAD